jgi:hypothetical protein
LFYSAEVEPLLRRKNVVHFFIYRDLRAVCVSEAHYLRTMNPWHRLHPYFRREPTIEDAISLAIRGLPAGSHCDYPDVATRFRRYQGWLNSPHVLAVRFEHLLSQDRKQTVRAMVEWYADHIGDEFDITQVTERALSQIDPARSHTFRQGVANGWRDVFSKRLNNEIQQIAGDLLEELANVPARSRPALAGPGRACVVDREAAAGPAG